MSKATPGMGGPRQSSFKKGQRGASLSPDDMKVASRLNPGPSVAPNENAGRPEPGFGPRKRPLFNQRYYRQSVQHPDNLFGNPDARRNIVEPG